MRITRERQLPADLDPLIDASVAEGHRFVERLRREWESGQNRFDRPGEALLTARVDGLLVAVCGLTLDPYSDDPGVCRLRRLYVLEPWRRRGIARQLVADLLARAAKSFLVVRLRTDTESGDRFYRALGFTPLETRDATHEWRLDTESRD